LISIFLDFADEQNLLKMATVTILGIEYPIATTTHLDLSNKNLTHIPSEIKQLINLEYLFLQDNQLTEICPEIGQLINLQYLELQSNRLTTICPQIAQLVNLKTINLNDNYIFDKNSLLIFKKLKVDRKSILNQFLDDESLDFPITIMYTNL